MINTILQGDALELAKSLPDNFCHCIITSPPYWQLRDYQTGTWYGGSGECDHVANPKATKTFGNSEFNQDRPSREETKTNGYYKPVCPKCGAIRIDSQMGLEETPEQYIENMVLLFRELRRVLRKDGTLWLNMGDSYASGGRGTNHHHKEKMGNGTAQAQALGHKTAPPGLKDKDLCGIPWRLALALQQDGWYLRSDIIWSKPNPMPESVTDRPTKAHEYLFLLTKSPKYFYDAEAIREPHAELSLQRAKYEFNGMKQVRNHPSGHGNTGNKEQALHPNGRNRRSVWEIAQNSTNAFLEWLATQDEVEDLFSRFNGEMANGKDVWNIATQPYPEAHFATFPEALIEPCILAGTSAKGVCGECGSQWERVLQKEGAIKNTDYANEKRSAMQQGGKSSTTLNGKPPQINTTGWQPTCKCPNNTPMPAIVLDPFFGSGTTGSVAKRLGRYYLGFELNPDYIKLATKRINNTQPPLFVLT